MVFSVRLIVALSLSLVLPAAHAASPRLQFDLPAGEAEASLKHFSEESGQQVIFPTQLVRGVRTHAAEGRFTPDEALQEMLRGTGLTAVQDQRTGAYALRRLPPSPVTVNRPALSPEPASAGSPPNDQVVTLSEFDIVGSHAGYAPTESSTGSRIAARIKDLPYAISAVTSDFVKDFGIFALTDELAFSSSMNGLNDVGGFTLRGFAGNISLRNGFARLGFFDPVVYERIEFIRGPAASIYGQTNPGGVVNFITKQPKSAPHQSFDQTFGSFALQRTQIESTGPVPIGQGDPKLFYIVEAAYDHRRYDSPNQAATTRAAYVDFIYRFTPTTSLSLDFDYEYRSFLGGTSGTPLPEVFDFTQPTTSTHQWTGIAYDLTHRYYTDASAWNHRTVYNEEATFESKLTDALSLRASGDVYRSPRYSYTTGLGSQYDPTTRMLLNRSNRTTYSFLEGDGISAAVDLLSHYTIPRQGDQKTLFTVDYYKNQGKRPAWTLTNSWSGGAADPNAAAPAWHVDAPTFTPYIPFSPANYSLAINSGGLNERDYAEATGASVRHYGDLWERRLAVALGVRVDRVYEFKEALAGTPAIPTPLPTFPYYTPTSLTKELGLVYRLNSDVNAYVNRSESFVPNSPSTLTSTGEHLVNQVGVGYEAGVKGAVLDGNLHFTAAAFWIKLKGISVSAVDVATGTTTNIANGTQYGRGVEFDCNWALTDRLQAIASASYVDAYYGQQGADLDLTGRKVVGWPLYQFNVHANWQVRPGLAFTGAIRWYDKFRVDNATSTAAPFRIGGLQVANDGRREIWARAYSVVDVGVIYRWKTTAPYRQRLQLALKNIFDTTYVIVGSRVPGDQRGLYLTYGIER
jgi:iron complex outermembrane recepter protein